MTSPVPAGAGGVDRDDLVTSARKRAAELMDNLRETQGWHDGATMLALASELRALRAALAAAEQRAEALSTVVANVSALADEWRKDSEVSEWNPLAELDDALSSRPGMDGNHISIPGPVQPESDDEDPEAVEHRILSHRRADAPYVKREPRRPRRPVQPDTERSET